MPRKTLLALSIATALLTLPVYSAPEESFSFSIVEWIEAWWLEYKPTIVPTGQPEAAPIEEGGTDDVVALWEDYKPTIVPTGEPLPSPAPSSDPADLRPPGVPSP